MDVATPTEDCLNMVYDLLSNVLLKGKNKSMLSHQEVRAKGEWVSYLDVFHNLFPTSFLFV